MRQIIPAPVRRRLLEAAGWVLVVAGLAGLVLPGPGLLLLASGLAVLTFQYRWARNLAVPVRDRAISTAAHGVETWPRIAASTLGGLALITIGIVWGLWREVPVWWPLDDSWWLPGGWVTGVTVILSGVVALALIIYSIRRFRMRQDVPRHTQKSQKDGHDGNHGQAGD